MRMRAGRPLTAPMKLRRRREFLWTEVKEWSRTSLRRRRRWWWWLSGLGVGGCVVGGVREWGMGGEVDEWEVGE
jgi:hypothetical protein